MRPRMMRALPLKMSSAPLFTNLIFSSSINHLIAIETKDKHSSTMPNVKLYSLLQNITENSTVAVRTTYDFQFFASECAGVCYDAATSFWTKFPTDWSNSDHPKSTKVRFEMLTIVCRSFSGASQKKAKLAHKKAVGKRLCTQLMLWFTSISQGCICLPSNHHV